MKWACYTHELDFCFVSITFQFRPNTLFLICLVISWCAISIGNRMTAPTIIDLVISQKSLQIVVAFRRVHFEIFNYREYFKSLIKEARKGFSLLLCLWNDGRLQKRIFNGVGKIYVSLQFYCWATLSGHLWRHISYHGNAQGPEKRPLNFSFCKLSEKLIRWPTIIISLFP